jgi:hypothetical protein
MLFLILVYFLAQGNLGSDLSPIPPVGSRADTCNELRGCQTIWSIIWSCFSTILFCTWVTLHLNISIVPDTPGMSRFGAKLHSFLKNRILLFIWVLLVLGYILVWAIRQHLKAGEIQQEWNDHQNSANQKSAPARKWTRAHGFFTIMGGVPSV